MRLFRSKTASRLVAASWLAVARGSSNSVLVWENTTTYAAHIGFPDQAVFCRQTPVELNTWNFPYTIDSSGSILIREVNLYVTSDKVWRVGTATQGSSKLSARLTPAHGHIKKSTDFVAGDYDSLLDTRESTEPVDALIPGVLTVTSAQTGGSITITNLTTLITSHGGAEMYLELVWQNGDKNFSRPFTVVDLKDLDTTRKNPIYSSSVPYGSDLTGGSDGGDGGNDGSGNGNGVITQNPLSGSNLPATEAMPISTASTTSGSATSLGALTTTTASTSTSVGIVIATGLPVATSSATAPNSGLSTGAKAGIAVAAAITGLALLAGLVFLFLRRRRRHSTLSHDPAYFENQHNPGLMAQKEATVGTVDVTPTSPYFDHGGSRISIQQPIMTQTRGGDGDRGSSQVHDQGGETGGDARPGSATAGSLTGRVTPHGAVSHLVEDGMTEEEIRRLEEEERELDQAIEQAGAGRRG